MHTISDQTSEFRLEELVRNYQIVIASDLPLAGQHTVEFHRERLHRINGANLATLKAGEHKYLISSLAPREVTLGDATVLTAAQIFEALDKLSDQLAAEENPPN